MYTQSVVLIVSVFLIWFWILLWNWPVAQKTGTALGWPEQSGALVWKTVNGELWSYDSSPAIISCSGTACNNAADLFPSAELFASFGDHQEFFQVEREAVLQLVNGLPGWRGLPVFQVADSSTRIFLPNQFDVRLQRVDCSPERAAVIISTVGCRVSSVNTASCLFVAEIPWGHPSTVFEIAEALEQHPEVLRADPVAWIEHELLA